jgi:hypothetical protein
VMGGIPMVVQRVLQNAGSRNTKRRIRLKPMPNGNARKVWVDLTTRIKKSRYIFKSHFLIDKSTIFGLAYGMGPVSIARGQNV